MSLDKDIKNELENLKIGEYLIKLMEDQTLYENLTFKELDLIYQVGSKLSWKIDNEIEDFFNKKVKILENYFEKKGFKSLMAHYHDSGVIFGERKDKITISHFESDDFNIPFTQKEEDFLINNEIVSKEEIIENQIELNVEQFLKILKIIKIIQEENKIGDK